VSKWQGIYGNSRFEQVNADNWVRLGVIVLYRLCVIILDSLLFTKIN